MGLLGPKRPRIMVTGAGGLLGHALREAAAATPLASVFLTRAELDIADREAVAAALDVHRPELVLNAAAYTNVDGAEREPEAAVRANVLGPAVLAAETARRGQGLLHVSTDHVFAGRASRPYREDDETGPQSVYGLTKEQGEGWVRRLQPRHWLVRTAGLFGTGRNFVAAIVARAERGQPLRVVADQVCNRTYAPDLAAALLELATSEVALGTYQVTNAGASSWYDFAREIVAALGVSAPLEPVSTRAWGAPAWRPAYSVLSGARWQATGLTPLREVEPALREYLQSITVSVALDAEGASEPSR